MKSFSPIHSTESPVRGVNGVDIFLVGFGCDGNRDAGAAGTACAADAVDIVFRMGWQVEVEDMADIGNVEATGSHITGNQNAEFTALEAVQGMHARSLIHIAMQSACVKTMLGQGTAERGNVALTVTEDNRILQILGVVDQFAQSLALCPRVWSRRQQGAE